MISAPSLASPSNGGGGEGGKSGGGPPALEGSRSLGRLDAQTDHDLQQLQREFRHMELNRKAYAGETQQMIKKQQAKLAMLKKEAEALKLQLAMEDKSYKRLTPTGKGTDQVADHRAKIVELESQVDAERRACSYMDEQMTILRRKALHLRKTAGGVNAARESDMMQQKQIRILEDRLDKALMKFNQSLSQNKNLRQEIDDLRRERSMFESIQGKMYKELEDRKKKMAVIIEKSNRAYEQRDAYQMETVAIEQANQREQEDFASQIIELTEELEEALSPPATLWGMGGTMGSSTMSATGLGSLPFGRHSGYIADPDAVEETIQGGKQDENELGGASAAAAAAAAAQRDRLEIQASVEKIQNYEEAFNRIKAATGIESVDELVQTFVKNEDQNFSLFNYVNEQQREIEKLEEEAQELSKEEERHAHETGEGAHHHKKAIQNLEARLEASESANVAFNDKCTDIQVTLDFLKDEIKTSLCALFGAQGDVPSGLLADGVVMDSNIIAALAAIEDRANELLKRYNLARAKEKRLATSISSSPQTITEAGENLVDRDDASPSPTAGPLGRSIMTGVLGVGPKVPMGKDVISVTPPRLDDYSSDDEDASDEEMARPFTRDELKERTLSKMERKRARATQIRSGGGSSSIK